MFALCGAGAKGAPPGRVVLIPGEERPGSDGWGGAETALGVTDKPRTRFAAFPLSHPNGLRTRHLCFLPVPGKAGTGDQQQRIKAPSCTGPCRCSSRALLREPSRTTTVSSPNRQKSRWIFKSRFAREPWRKR